MDYSVFIRVANSILTKFGVSGTLSRETSGTYNTATGVAAVSASSQTVKLAAFPYPTNLIDGTMIRAEDLQVFVDPTNLTNVPEPADVLTFQGADYTVISVKNYRPAGTSVLYELQVRR